MRIEITSTSDTPENVQAALGNKTPAPGDSGKQAGDGSQSEAQGKPESEVPANSDAAETEVASETDDDVVETASDDESGEAAAASGKDKSKKNGGGFQKRISKLTAEKAALRQEIEYWRTAATQKPAAADPKSTSEPEAPKPQAQTNPRPMAGDFTSHAEYEKALDAWFDDRVEAKLTAREQKAREAQAKNARSETEKSFAQRSKSFAETTPDYDSTIADAMESKALFISEAMHNVLLESENGPALFYELAKNPAESVRIGQLPPHKALMEMGKLEARVTAQTSPGKTEQPKTTKAPKPLEPVGSKGASVDKDIYDPKLSQKEYERIRAKQRAEAAKHG